MQSTRLIGVACFLQVTTPDDMMVAEGLIGEHKFVSQQQIPALQPA